MYIYIYTHLSIYTLTKSSSFVAKYTWLVVWNVFCFFQPLGNVITPIDKLIFFRGVSSQPPDTIQSIDVGHMGLVNSTSSSLHHLPAGQDQISNATLGRRQRYSGTEAHAQLGAQRGFRDGGAMGETGRNGTVACEALESW